MKPVTIVTTDGQTFRCDDMERFVIGGDNSSIPIPGDTSKNEYAYLQNRDGHVWLVPATPAVPLLLNGRPTTEAAPLRNGDRVGIGQVEFAFELSDGLLRIEPAPTVLEIATPPAPETMRSDQRRPGRIRLFKLMLSGVFLALLVVLLFTFLATPVSILIDPQPAELEVQGFPPAVPVQGRYLVLPGDYRVEASKPGYEVLRETVSIEGGEFRELTYALTKLPGRVNVYSSPAPAQVSIDGEYAGPTPLLQRKVPAGQRQLVITAERYQPEEVVLEVEGMDVEQSIRVELAPDWAPVTFRTEPDGAAVVIAGEQMGVTPFTIDLLSGTHDATFELERYLPQRLDVSVVAGVAQALPVIVLTPTPAAVIVISEPEGASVTVDEKFAGTTPTEFELTPNVDHQLTLAKSGYVTENRTLNLEAAEEKNLSIKLAPQYGVVFITSDPADAVVYVDGKLSGPASQRLRLTTRQHTLEFRRPGYQTHRVTLLPRAGVSKELTVSLKPEGTAEETSTPPVLRTGEGQELKLIKPGRFTMGASRREQGRRANENLRRVDLSRPYYLSAREVTNAEFRRFKPEHESGSAYGRSLDQDDQPVVNVKWSDAVAYLNWLSERDGLPPVYRSNGENWEVIWPLGKGYRLPTEAEWANAARFTGPEPKKYAWGETYPPTARVENFADRSAGGLLPYSLASYDDNFPVTAPVGSFSANESGLFDMGGNVAEWTNDYYSVYAADVDAVMKDPVGPTVGGHHVVRGASWKDSTISELRLSHRDYSNVAREDVGFRIARYAD